MILDLFAGPGGWDVAARGLGFEPLGIEWDDAACATREAAGLRTLQADIAELDPLDTLREYVQPAGWPTGLLASPPCQGFSSAGKGKGRQDAPLIRRAAIQMAHSRDHRSDYEWADERSALVLEPLRWALTLRPEWTCWEQVPTVLPFWALCARLLEARGYSTWTGYLHAEQYGVPQTRKRAFLIASRAGAVAPPVPTHSKYYPRDKTRLDPGVLPWVSMAEALGWGMTERPSTTVKARPRPDGRVLDGGSGAQATLDRERERGAWLRSNYGTGGDASKRGERLQSEPAPTLTSKADRMKWVHERPATSVNCDPRISPPGRDDPAVSGSQQKGAVRVTVQEAAVLQSFPADYPWQGTKTKQFEQVGNAVPPGLALPVLQAAMAASVVDLEQAA